MVSHIKLGSVNGSKIRFKSENLSNFEKFSEADRNFFLQKMLDFGVLYAYFGVKD